VRQLTLDTETTGMDVGAGHRVIEIGCVEICERVVTGRRFHAYLNPDRDSEPGALAVHGLTREFLSDKPRFRDIVDEWLAFIDGAELLAHNASFDVGFLLNELKLSGREPRLPDSCAVVDTLALARELHPGQRNSLDALCKRYEVDASARQVHGALLDARLLADVYLAMTAGQGTLDLVRSADASQAMEIAVGDIRVVRRMPSDAELAAHAAYLAALEKRAGKAPIWKSLEVSDARVSG
jgi:DNA polymerase-3 subunit epsilon